MKINLSDDFDRVYQYIMRKIDSFDITNNPSPGSENNTISLVSLGYQFDQAGWVSVVFDTRTEARPDGQWALHIDGNMLEMNHWVENVREMYEKETVLTIELIDGSEIKLDETSNEEDFNCLGQMLLSVLVKLRDDRAFEKLPLANMAVMSVEEINGTFGWPPYDKLNSLGNLRSV